MVGNMTIISYKSISKKNGLYHETFCSQTPLQNGIAERKNRHILETARALLTATHVPRRYWRDAVVPAVYLLNRNPSRVLNFETPLQVLAHRVPLPSVLMLPPRIFGCVAYVHHHKNQRTKLDPCAIHYVFLGYAAHKKGYRCYDPIARRLYTTMDVTFLESETFFPKPNSHSSHQGELLGEEQNVNSWENWPSFDDTNFKEHEIDGMIKSDGAQLLSFALVETQPRLEKTQGDLGMEPMME